ncbi:MAG: hypothetical protein QMD14_05695 [Candidatus Aenigmarchaeota archaeon]|nr:hypothetical protein [Candidatus Aenigmarchaeota archaeon]
MSEEEILKKATVLFPSLLKNIDEISFSQLAHEMRTSERIFEWRDFVIKDKKEVELIENVLYERLENKILKTLSPTLERYGLRCSYYGGKRWLSDKEDDQYRLSFSSYQKV